MKKTLLSMAVAASIGLVAAPSHAFLLNWNLDPDGAAGAATTTTINELLDIVGPSYVQTTVPNGSGGFTFNEWGAIVVQGHDGGAGFTGFATNGLTATFTTTGFATLGGAISYTGGQFNVYSTTPATWATASGIYGSNTGTLIGTFNVEYGGGFIDPVGIPNGVQTIAARASYLASGYWFDEFMNDLSGGTTPFVLGFATTNASRVANPSSLVVSEIVNEFGGDATFTNCLPGQLSATCTTGAGEFVISNNGQYRLQVPEPGTLALMGLGLVGLGFRRRQK